MYHWSVTLKGLRSSLEHNQIQQELNVTAKLTS